MRRTLATVAILSSVGWTCRPPPDRMEVRPGCVGEVRDAILYRRGVTIWSRDRDVLHVCYRTVTACGTTAAPARDGAWYWGAYGATEDWGGRHGDLVPLVFPCGAPTGRLTEYSEEHPHGIERGP